MSLNTQSDIDKLIELYFNQPRVLYEHLFSSYHQFVGEIIPYSLTQEKNYFYENVDKEIIYLHGFACSNIRIKPPTFDNDNEIKFPSDARKNHLNYFSSVVADVEQFVEKVNSITGDKTIKIIATEKETPVANIPVMVKSRYCSTNIKQNLKGECRYDPGGYFIVNGAEKVIMTMEKMTDNEVFVFSKKDESYEDGLIYTVQINSRRNDWSDNLQILTIKNRKDGVLSVSTSLQLVDIPLFILMRALGIESDQDIISYITYDLNDIKMLNLVRSSVINCTDEEGIPIRTKEEAMQYLITKLRRNKRISQTDEDIAKIQKRMYLDKILREDLLPHLGEDLTAKISFLGLMTNRLLNVILGRREIDDRDAMQNKRVETPGVSLGQLFRQNWKKMLNEIGKHFKKKNQSDENPINVIGQIKPSVIEQSLKTALATGTWGMNRTKKGIAQALQRLSWVQGISYLRRVMAPSMEESTSKVTSIRQVANNQTQMLCCLTGETEVLMSDRMTTKKIINIVNGDTVTTVNRTSLIEEPSRIYNKFGRMSNKLFEIKTISGRTIKATSDHPFLVYMRDNNRYVMKNAGDLKLTDKLVVRHMEKMIVPEKETIVIINEADVLPCYHMELLTSGYLGKPIAQDRLVIIARLIGALNSKTSALKTEEDKQAMYNDICYLGFGDSVSNNIKIIENSVFEHLLELLGMSNGAIIPSWIINGNKLIKREFLAANQSISCLETEIIQKDINNMLKEFNVTIETSNKSHILINYINYADNISVRYCEQQRHELAHKVEYLKVCQESGNTPNYDDFIKMSTLPSGDISISIKYIKEIPNEMIYDFTTESDNHSFIANSFVVSNCVETPEGAKIGIVKSMAMMAGISMQNTTQADVLKSLLKMNKDIKHPYDVDPLTMNSLIKIMLNGNWIGVCKLSQAHTIYDMLKKKRRENVIDKMTSITFDHKNKEIKVYFDGGRLIRPVLIVNDNKLNITKEVMDDVNKELLQNDKSKSWIKIMAKYPNLIEYEDIISLNHLLVAESNQRLFEAIEAQNRKVEYNETTKINRYGDYRWVKYTHCDFHAWTMMGTVVSNIPFSNHNYANRNIIHFSQAKQSIGIYISSLRDRMDISQVLYHPQIPLVTTQAMKYNGCLDLPYGENAIIAVASYDGGNQEDSIIFNQSAIDRGIFRADTLKKFHSEIEKNPSTSQDDIFTKPDRNKVTDTKQGNYDKLTEKGFVPEETELVNEDIIIGKISPIQPTGNNNKVYKDSSEILKTNVDGVVDRVHTGIYNAEGYEMYNMRVRFERKPTTGDKFTCYDDSHEVLTTDGWINIKDITREHKVASLNDGGKLVYQTPTATQSYDYEGKMYLVESNQVSLCVTPNHRMWVRGRTGKYKALEAETIYNQRKYYKKNVDDIVVDKNEEFFVYDKEDNITHFKLSDKNYEINAWLSFFGIWLAEGHVDKASNYVKVSAHKDRVWEPIKNFCEDCNLTYHSAKDKPTAPRDTIFTISNKDLGGYMLQFSVGAVNKFMPQWTWSLTPKLCRVLIDSMMLGDGHTMENGTRRYDSSSKRLANDLQRLCLHAGFATNIIIKYKAGHCSEIVKGVRKGEKITSTCDAYRMTIIETQVEPLVNKNIKKTKDGVIGNLDSWVDFKGTVYCCTVPGPGVIYVRRDSIVSFCGNSRHGQKGTVGIAFPQRDMPFTASGMVPDCILNPHGYPSRMSLGHFIECLASKEAAETCHFVDGTPFNNYDIKKLPETLKKLGFSPYGTETMYCGFTGRKMDAEIFIGPVYTIRLKHMVLDKVHGRARGPKQALTRQPLEGRSRDGGLKIGEMENNAIVAHGMGQFLKERFMEASDITKTYVCDECGMFASKVIDKDYYRCKGCHNSTRISAVVIPYACKLLFQELTAVNILPRIRTERSIHGDEV